MRRFGSALVLAGLLSSHIAAAQCTRMSDTTAFEVTGLKTRLLVTALTCKADARYNEFVTRYRPELTSEDRNLNGYFSRVNGRNSSKARDEYVTEMANNDSQSALRHGSLFCDQNLPIFDEVMALRGGTELATYAGAKSVGQPGSYGSCAAEPVAARGTARSTRTTRRARR